jgi:hypothetical protein
VCPESFVVVGECPVLAAVLDELAVVESGENRADGTALDARALRNPALLERLVTMR